MCRVTRELQTVTDLEPEEPSYRRRVVVDPEILSGKPAIKGTRIPVTLVLNLIAHGYSFERIVEAYPVLTVEDIKAALIAPQQNQLLPIARR
jgi:uncharacterized protein (DUF433 family)